MRVTDRIRHAPMRLAGAVPRLAVALAIAGAGLVMAFGGTAVPSAGASTAKPVISPAAAFAAPALPSQQPKPDHSRGPAPAVKTGAVLPQVTTAPTAHYVVDTTTDLPLKTPASATCVDTATTCSLRAAVAAADNAAKAKGVVATVTVPAGTYLLETQTATQSLDVTASMVVHGAAGTAAPVVSGVGKVGVFDITGEVSVELSDLVVEDGAAADGADISSEGAGLTLDGVTVEVGKATSDGGGLYATGGSVWMDATTVFTGNSAEDGGALYSTYAAVFAEGTTFSHNTATTDGGAVYQDGAMTAQHTVYTANTAGSGGAAVYNDFTLDTTGGTYSSNAVVSTTTAYGGVLDDVWAATVTGASFATSSTTAKTFVEGGVFLDAYQLTLDHVTVSGTSNTCAGCEDIAGGVVYNASTTQLGDPGLMATGLTVTGTSNESPTTSVIAGGVVDDSYQLGFATLDGLSVTGTTDEARGEVEGGVLLGLDWLTLRDARISATSLTLATASGDVYGGAVGFETNASVDGLSVSTTTVDVAKDDVEGGAVNIDGGNAVSHLDITGTSVVDQGGTVEGGGLYFDSATSLSDSSIVGTVVADTSATSGSVEGGGWYNGDEVMASGVEVLGTTITAGSVLGGAFVNRGDASTITNSTFADVSVTVSGTGEADGVALALDDLTDLVNVTADGAIASVGPKASASALYFDTIAQLTNDTISGDAITSRTGASLTGVVGGMVTTGPPVYVKNTIVATTSPAQNCETNGSDARFVSGGGNIDSGTSCGFTQTTDQQSTDPLVAAVAANGGPVETAALLPTSPAIDGGVGTGCPATDARGVPRPVGHCDVGAFQVSGQGYWLVAGDGGIFSYGTAQFYGSMGGIALNAPVVGMASRPDQLGYWEVASDGGIFSFGTVHFHGSMGGIRLNAPVVGMAVEPQGGGYWEVAADGGIFSFGSAQFYGSMGGQHLDAPVVGMAAAPTGHGYWEVAADGGIFAFGSAQFYGSMGGQHLDAPVVGLAATPTGEGYWELAADGGVFAFGRAIFLGSMGGQHLDAPVDGGATFNRL